MSSIDQPHQENVDECRDILNRFDGEGEAFAKRITVALARIGQSGGVDGNHHKAWTLDQVVRILAGPAYEEWRKWFSAGEDGKNTYEWDEGIPP